MQKKNKASKLQTVSLVWKQYLIVKNKQYLDKKNLHSLTVFLLIFLSCITQIQALMLMMQQIRSYNIQML